MTDDSNDLPEAPPRRHWRLLLLVLALLVLGVACWQIGVLVRTFQDDSAQLRGLVRDLNTLEVQTSKLETRQSDQAEAARRNSLEIAAFGDRFAEQNQLLSRLDEQLQGGRTRMQMMMVEHLLLTANERLQLERDVDAAATALELAEERLSSIGEPRLFNVRRAVADERAALRALPHVDAEAAALTFSSLIARVPRLPLRARVPDHFEARPDHADVDVPVDAGWAGHAWASIKEAMSGVFAIRRNRGPAPRLLAPDQEALVYQVLSMKLEGARLAMLRGDAVSYRDLCNSASMWLRDYFRPDDPGVLAAQAELERLRPLQLDPTLPDISRSLTLLRAQMEPSAR